MQVHETSNGRGIYRTQARKFTVRLLLTTALCGASGFTSVVANAQDIRGSVASRSGAASEARRFSFAIPAQSVDGALAAFSRVTHFQTVAAGELTRNVRSPGVSGIMTSDVALDRLLTGTGLAPRISGNTVILSKASANITLGPVRVGGTIAHQDPQGPGIGYVAQNTMAGTKTDTPITEIPNSIYVVTKQLMQDQQPQSVQEALRYIPGVYAESEGTYGNGASYNNASGIVQRGFDTRQFIDGIMTNSLGSGEPSFLERIDVINGPASVMYGQTTPGGMLATTLKKPTDTPLHQATLGFGNWGRYQATLDLSDKITKSGTVRYRIAAIGDTQGTQTNYIKYHRVGILPSIKWDIDQDTSLTVLGSYLYTPGDGTGAQYPAVGTLFPGVFGQISRKNFLLTRSWNKREEKDASIEYILNHAFNKNIKFSQVFRWEKTDGNINDSYFSRSVSATEIAVQPWEMQQHGTTVGLDTRLYGTINTGQLTHTWVVGTDFRYFDFNTSRMFDRGTYGSYGNPIVNIYNPAATYSGYASCFSWTGSGCKNTGSDAYYSYFQEGVYFQDQIKWKGLSVIVGGREDWVNYHGRYNIYSNQNVGNNKALISSNKNASIPQQKFTWRAGIIYNSKVGISPYFSYSTSFLPQTSVDYLGKPFSPLTGKQLEVGVKYKVPNKDILLTATMFRVDENHYLINDLVHTGYSTDGGRVRSQGFEVSANANITKDLKLVASYSYTDIRFVKSNVYDTKYDPRTDSYYGGNVGEEGKSVPHVPRNIFSLFSDYTIPSSILKGVGVNWGIRYVGFTFADNVESYKTKPYALFDIGTHYDLGQASPIFQGLRAQFSVSNLTNKYYITACSDSLCYLGQGRRLYGNLTYNW